MDLSGARHFVPPARSCLAKAGGLKVGGALRSRTGHSVPLRLEAKKDRIDKPQQNLPDLRGRRGIPAKAIEIVTVFGLLES